MRPKILFVVFGALMASAGHAQTVLNGGGALNGGSAQLKRVQPAPEPSAEQAPTSQVVAQRQPRGPVDHFEQALVAALASGWSWSQIEQSLIPDDTSPMPMREVRAAQTAAATLLEANGPAPVTYTADGALPSEALFEIYGHNSRP